MLQLLKESVSSRHAERLETIVIWLIVIEIGAYSVLLSSVLPIPIIPPRLHLIPTLAQLARLPGNELTRLQCLG